MINNLDDNLIGIAIGIRFRSNFSILDNFGKIIDCIMGSGDSFFTPYFSQVAETSIHQRLLVSENTEDKLTIDTSNIILETFFNDDAIFKLSDLPEIINNFDKLIIKGILRDFGIKDITRLGYVKRYLFTDENVIKRCLENTIDNYFKEINELNIHFSKKIILFNTLLKPDKNDYENAIYNFAKEPDKDEVFIALDYQRFYKPHLETSMKIEFPQFIERATKYSNDNLLTWLNRTSS
jgi:hypothetical protein